MNTNSSTIKRVYLALLFDGLCVSSASVVLPLLRDHYQLEYSTTGLLLAFLSAGNLVSALLCGILPRWLSRKTTVMLLTSCMALGYAILTVSGSPAFLALGFICIGFGKGSSMNSGTALAGNLAEDRTKSLNIINALYATGSLLAPFIYSMASREGLPWWTPLSILIGVGILLWLSFLSIHEYDRMSGKPAKSTGKSSGKEAQASGNSWEFLREKHFWLSTALLFGQQCAEISVTGWLVTYYKDTGILSGVYSEYTVMVIWLSMLTARLVIAYLLPEKAKKNMLVFMGAASLVTYLLMLLSNTGVTAIISLILFGLSIAGVYPTAIAQASKGLSNESLSVLIPLAGIGSILMPYLTGAVAERIGLKGGMACSIVALVWMLIFAILARKSAEQAEG